MTKKIERAQISNDGLRYKERPTGSPFYFPANTNSVKSCFLCGLHKPLTDGRTRKLLGKNHFVCFGCKPDPAGTPQ